MELKLFFLEPFQNPIPVPFNRTSMELKPDMYAQQAGSRSAFNRTSMELKLVRTWCRSVAERSFNRTSMELKLRYPHKSPRRTFPIPTFNRTSMELKL